MTSLVLRYRGKCHLCGCRLRGFRVGSYRVNKHSLVPLRGVGDLVSVERKCPECLFEAEYAMYDSTWRFSPESQATVDAIRARKGWAT